MSDLAGDRKKQAWLGIAGSVLLHGSVVAAILLYFALTWPVPPQEQTVSVSIVEPPKPESEEAPPPPPSPPPKPTDLEALAEALRQQMAGKPIDVLDPAFRFGKDETGIDKAQDGGAAEEANEAEAEAAVSEDMPPPTPKEAIPAAPDEIPDAAKADAEKAESEREKARQIYSKKEFGSKKAQSDLANVSRTERVKRLCASELREQLRRGSPRYLPELIPAPTLKEGVVADIPNAAFYAGGKWYDLSFRCELDSNATEVISFSHKVGNPIPKSEWKARGFPEN